MKDFSALKRKQAYHVCINVEKFMKKSLSQFLCCFFFMNMLVFILLLTFMIGLIFL